MGQNPGDPHEVERVRERVEKTICPTFSAERGETLEGRISRADFDYLMDYIDYLHALGSADQETLIPMRASPGKILHRSISVDTSAGADPDAIDDASKVYGDSLDLFPMVERHCENPDAPAGQCEFNAVAIEHDRCVYCGKRTG